MGVGGAAYATIIAQAISAVALAVYCIRKIPIIRGLATLFWTKLLRTRNYFNYSSYPADFRVFNPLYSTGVR